MNELQLNNHLSFPKCKFTPQSLEIDSSASYDEWTKIGNFLNTIEGVSSLWRGDWLNFGDNNYKEFSQIFDPEDKISIQALRDSKYVATAVEPSRRRDTVSPSIYKEIATLDEKTQEEVMDMCEEKHLTKMGVRELVKEIRKQPTPPLPEGVYQVIYADPPWAYDVDLSSGATRSPENNYPVMDLAELVKFGEKVKSISDKNCILFMWITAPKLNWMMPILESWGFEYKTNLIWDKVKPNMGHYSSVRHEILIIAGKGSAGPTTDGVTIQSIDSVQSIEKSPRHSEKPQEFREIIKKLYPDKNRIELFSRIKSDGFDVWGNDKNIQ